MHRSFPRDNLLPFINLVRLVGVGSFLWKTAGPRGTAAAVAAKNSPPDCFLNAATVLQEITCCLLSTSSVWAGLFLFFGRAGGRGPRAKGRGTAESLFLRDYFCFDLLFLSDCGIFLNTHKAKVSACAGSERARCLLQALAIRWYFRKGVVL